MRYRDTVGALFWFAVGVVFCTGAFRYSLMRAGIPGAGLFPLLAGLALILLSLVGLAESLRNFGADRGEKSPTLFVQKDSWRKLALALAGLFGYWFLLGPLGFLLTTLLFMFFLLRFIEPQRWITTLSTTFLTTGLSYAVFRLWLRVPLPKGILGF